MNTAEIEARVVSHEHSPLWYKATLHGCQFDSFRGAKNDRIITGYAKVRSQTLLTFRIAGGDMDDLFEDLWIVCVDPAQPEQILGNTHQGYLKGPFEILAHGNGDLEASRLQTWWFEWAPIHGGQTPQMAKWLAQQLNQTQDVPVLYPNSFPEVNEAKLFHPVEAWTFEPIK